MITLWRRGTGRLAFTGRLMAASKSTAALGPNKVDRLRLRLMPALLLWSPRVRAVRLAYNGIVLRVLIGDLSEYHALQEVFVDEAYGADLPVQAGVVVDLGANVGLATLYFWTRWPDAEYVVVEPNPALQDRLRQNLSVVRQVTIVPSAVASDNGVVLLDVDGESWAGRVGDSGIEVAAVGIAGLLDPFTAVDVLKVDIEGSEFDVIPAAPLERVGMLLAEIHDTGDRGRTLVRAISDRGFAVTETRVADYLIVTAMRTPPRPPGAAEATSRPTWTPGVSQDPRP